MFAEHRLHVAAGRVVDRFLTSNETFESDLAVV